MRRNAPSVLDVVKALFEASVNIALDTIAPRSRPVPVVAMADREWVRRAAMRRYLSRR